MSDFSDRTLTFNLLRAYREASPQAIEAGQQWYDLAFTHCERQAWLNSVSVAHAVVALAHLSPRITWRQNLDHLEALLSGQDKPASALSRSWAIAQRSLEAEEPLGTFSRVALKTRNFARAILGDQRAVVLDVWSTRAAGAPENAIKSVGGYNRVADAYRRGARRVGISPRDLQAITWCAVRGAAH